MGVAQNCCAVGLMVPGSHADEHCGRQQLLSTDDGGLPVGGHSVRTCSIGGEDSCAGAARSLAERAEPCPSPAAHPSRRAPVTPGAGVCHGLEEMLDSTSAPGSAPVLQLAIDSMYHSPHPGCRHVFERVPASRRHVPFACTQHQLCSLQALPRNGPQRLHIGRSCSAYAWHDHAACPARGPTTRAATSLDLLRLPRL